MPSPVPETVAAERPRRAGSADTRLLLCIAIGQTIGWGTLFSTFALFGAPMEAELGWSRAAINAGLTLAMLVSGIAAVPIGQHVDRHGRAPERRRLRQAHPRPDHPVQRQAVGEGP